MQVREAGLSKRIFNLRFRTRLALVMFLITAVTSGVLTVAYVQYVQKIKGYVAGLTSDLVQITQVANAKLPPGVTRKEALTAYQKELKDAGLSSVTVVDPTGEVVKSTTPGLAGKRIMLRRSRRYVKPGPFQVSAKLHVVNIEPTVGESQYSIPFPITQGDKVLGYAVIGGEVDQVAQFLRHIYIMRLIWFLCTMAAGMTLIVYLAFRFTKPIDQLVDASQQVAQGNLYVTLPATSTDEMGRLAQTFNQMVERLRENRKLQERLNEAEKSSLLGHFAGTVAHEVRNSLNFLNLSVDQIRAKRWFQNEIPGHELSISLANMKEEITRLNRLVSDFLVVGRPTQPRLATCDIQTVVAQAVDVVEKQASRQHIQIAVDLPPGLPAFQADAAQLKTCFMNILTNSVQAMPQGGNISITGRLTPNTNGAGRLQLRFHDTGPGIPQDDQERVFTPYFSTKATGFGLGLAITRKIVEDHGGRVFVPSENLPGAVVIVELPFPEASIADRPAVAASRVV